jgi:predicted NBD/HSP70 family sugar kinase
VSQQELVRRTRLHQATVSRVLSELKRDGLVVEAPFPERAHQARGRRPSVVDLERERTVVLGIQLGLSQANLGLVDLRGGLVAADVVQLGPDPVAGPESIVERLLGLTGRVLPDGGRLLGVGVGVAGLLDPEAGTVRFHLRDETGVPVMARLEAALGVPAFLGTNVHAMALAEAWFGVGPEVQSVALLFVGRVIRLALVTAGRVQHGLGPREGMFGHAVMDPEGPPCECGQRGCLEALASVTRLETEVQRLAQALPESPLARHLAACDGNALEAIAAAARDGVPYTTYLLRGWARWLARAIVLIHYTVEPSQLLLTGTPQLVNGPGIQLIQAEVAELAPSLAGSSGVRSSTLPFPDIAIVGAATLALEPFFSQEGRWLSARERVAVRSATA